jgi:hypothetical protein
MTIIISVNGNKSGEGFLIAPVGNKIFPVLLGLSTDDGTSINASLQAVGGANVVLDQSEITITPNEQFRNIHATAASVFRNDTKLQILVAGTIHATFNLTSITQPQIWFKGRFQARFATDSDYYNEKRGTTNGWNFALEGEPDFVPEDSVPVDINQPVGREVRFNDPVALRSHVPSIGVHVSSIKGKVGTAIEEFFAGDPVIGLQVDLGPHTYLASNTPKNPADPPPAETATGTFEIMAIFEFHISDVFSGKSHNSEDRPKSGGFFSLTAEELTEYAITIDPGRVPSATFDNARSDALLTDYRSLSPANRTGTTEGRNFSTRIAHLGGSVTDGIAPLKRTLSPGWYGKEEFRGLLNDSLIFQPSESYLLRYFADFDSINFFARMFNYHSDEQCGQVHGSISTDILPSFAHGARLLRA